MTGADRGFFLVAALAAPVGMFLGGGVHSGQYELLPLHAHTLLFSWVTMALYGAFYAVSPTVANTRLAWGHFACAVLAAVLLPLGFVPFGGEATPDLIWIGATFALLSSALFIWSVIRSFQETNLA